MDNAFKEQKSIQDFNLKNLSFEDKQKLVGVFTFLLEEDKKQSPENYKKISN
ncbi:hypothetical protein K9M47_02085 [Candidatus Gracilibacteria bacterium]|nr:hypothetical protein [Candidatus Gracilibacteria bacterium]MCF7898896.1 hypothetical protein [Candidatus Paceibacterota bacterium]